MHIGFDAKRLFLNQTGLGNYSRTLVAALRAGFPEDKISLFAPKIANGRRTDQFLGATYELVTPQKTPRFLHAWWRSIRLAIIAKRKGIEVYHGLSHELPRNLRWTGIKSVVTIHDLIFLRYPENYAIIDREIYLRKVKYACKQADAVVAISERTAADLIKMLRVPTSKIQVIYQGCDPQFEQPISEEKLADALIRYGRSRPYLICLGTIEKRKNQLTLVKSFLAGKFFEQYDLVLVGSEKKHASVIKEYIKGKLGSNAISMISNAQFEDLPALIKGASLMIYPSFYEGFGLPILEALTVGTPVIAASGSCLEETGGEAAIYFKPNDPKELENQMNRVLVDEDLRQTMIAKGHAHRQNFSNEKMAKSYHELYVNLKKS